LISERLLSVVRCPACAPSKGAPPLERGEDALGCPVCDRRYPLETERGFVDLRPPEGTFAHLTAYADEEFHARPGPLRPPFLSAGVKIDMMTRFLRLSPEDRVLDIGCGNGRAAYFRRQRSGHMVAIDAGAHFATEAEASVDLVRGDIRRLPLADASFDKAYSLDVIEHLEEDGVRAVLEEARRILRPGGLFFIYSHVMMSSGLARFQRAVNRLVRWLDARGWVDNEPERRRKSDHLNALKSYEQLKILLTGAGFGIEKIRYYNVVVKSVVEDLLLPLAEHNLFRRSPAAELAHAPVGSAPPSPPPVGTRPAVGRWAHAPLALATALLKLDVLLFGRIRTGPFFLLLRAE
jgi:SAM-dependent methyltransferase